jgi:uncharacterized protein YndB with AHSA1/START domain
MPEVIRSIDIQAPPSAVWRWLASGEALRRWLSSDLDIDLLAALLTFDNAADLR